jgi:hypothetical protein
MSSTGLSSDDSTHMTPTRNRRGIAHERPPDAESDASLRVIPDINVMAVTALSVAAAQDELATPNIHALPEASGAADVWV